MRTLKNSIRNVKRVAEIEDYLVVNTLLKNDWYLLGIYQEENKNIYILGYIPKE